MAFLLTNNFFLVLYRFLSSLPSTMVRTQREKNSQYFMPPPKESTSFLYYARVLTDIAVKFISDRSEGTARAGQRAAAFWTMFHHTMRPQYRFDGVQHVTAHAYMSYTHSYRHPDTQIHRHIDNQTYRHIDTQTYRHTDRHKNIQTHRQTSKHTDT